MKLVISSSSIRQYALVLTVNLSIFTTGMSLAWPSPMMVKLTDPTQTPLPRPVTDEEGSWIVAAGFLCSSFTNIFGGMLLDLIGRKYCILFASIPKLCMAIALIFATDVWVLIFCRAIMIVTDSFLFVVVPVFASEIASKENRGSLGTFLQVFSSLGIVTTLSVGPFLSYTIFSTVFAAIIAVTTVPLLFLPDTPFYLFSKGKKDEAFNILTQLRESESLAEAELEEYKLSQNDTENVDRITLLKNATFWKSTALGVLVAGGGQLLGFNAISFYLQTILESTNTSVRSEIASAIIGAIQLLASVITNLITNKFGRRPILLTSILGMFLGMLGLGIFFFITTSEGYEIISFMNFLPIISLILVVFCFSAGVGSLLWLIVAEVYEGPSRAFGVSICISSSTLMTFVTTKYFATMTVALGPAATYWFFSSMCVLIGTLIAVFLPETKGKTFSEIQEAIGGKKKQEKKDLDKNKSDKV